MMWDGDSDPYNMRTSETAKDCNESCDSVYATSYTNGVVPSFKLETIKSLEINDLPHIKDRLERLEHQNQKIRKQNKILRKKLGYWRNLAAELFVLRRIKHTIDKDKNRSIIRG